MSKGNHIPSGVNYYGYEASSTKGKFHPEDVNAGQSQVKKISGSAPKHKMAKGTGSNLPDRVAQHSGKEHHTKRRDIAGKRSGPSKSSGADAHPAGVSKYKDATV